MKNGIQFGTQVFHDVSTLPSVRTLFARFFLSSKITSAIGIFMRELRGTVEDNGKQKCAFNSYYIVAATQIQPTHTTFMIKTFTYYPPWSPMVLLDQIHPSLSIFISPKSNPPPKILSRLFILIRAKKSLFV